MITITTLCTRTKYSYLHYYDRRPTVGHIVTKPIFHASRHAPAIANVTSRTTQPTQSPFQPARQPNSLNCNCTPTVIKMYISGGLIGVLRATRSIGRRRPWGACHCLRRPSSVSFRFSPIIRYLNFSVRARTRTYTHIIIITL